MTNITKDIFLNSALFLTRGWIVLREKTDGTASKLSAAPK